MQLSQIMATNTGKTRLPHKIPVDFNMYNIDPHFSVHPDIIYEVIGTSGEKIGEISGAILTPVLNFHQKLMLDPILDLLEEAIGIIDTDGILCFANKAYSTLMRIPLNLIVGKHIEEFSPNTWHMKAMLEEKEFVKKKQYVSIANRSFSIRVAPLYQEGIKIGAISIFTDVTQVVTYGSEVKRISSIAEELIREANIANELNRAQIIGQGPEQQKLITTIAAVAHTDVTVLIRGESGVGKEVYTKLIHRQSNRKDKPFISVNCAAIPDTLIESELFGYEEGTFTGAKKGGKIGKFQLADGGTLFLDEIGDMPLTMQAKLLRVLQSGEIEKIGREENIPVDVRFIAATNQPLEEMIEQKLFRKDLFYRLNIVTLTIQPLRKRPNDIVLFINHYVDLYGKKYGKELSVDREVYNILMAYPWPGNVRELENTIEVSVIMCAGDTITQECLPENILGPEFRASSDANDNTISSQQQYSTLREEVKLFEQAVIQNVLQQCDGNREKACSQLGISVRTFLRKIQ